MVLYGRWWYGMGAYYRWVFSTDGCFAPICTHMLIVNQSRKLLYTIHFRAAMWWLSCVFALPCSHAMDKLYILFRFFAAMWWTTWTVLRCTQTIDLATIGNKLTLSYMDFSPGVRNCKCQSFFRDSRFCLFENYPSTFGPNFGAVLNPNNFSTFILGRCERL